MKIGVYGMAFQSTNKGCEALAYSCLKIINEIAAEIDQIYEIYIIQKMPIRLWIKSCYSLKKVKSTICPMEKYDHLEIKSILPLHSKNTIFYSLKISSLDLVIDFTEGDSFSDIYGRDRFFSDTNFKLLMIKHHIPYILGSQTIGPFADDDVKAQAAKIINNCLEVYVRDEMSYICTKKISGRKPILTTDVAFLLPYNNNNNCSSDRIRVGFNPSGLLWQQKSANSQNIKLTVDYKTYCYDIIEFFLEYKYVEVYLISHAASVKQDGSVEEDSDVIPCKELHERYPDTKIVDVFKTAIAAKSFIASLDFFVGGRMHATIAAISTSVPVVPFSYSRKFEGLFGNIGYPYLVRGTKDSTSTAVENTKKWFRDKETLKKSADEATKCAKNMLRPFIEGIKNHTRCI